MTDRTTSFGFTEIPEREKQARVAQVFSSVARSYDRMNDLMSAGVHRLWKDDFVTRLAPQPGMRVIDVAGGTGDIAFRIRDRVAAKRPPADGTRDHGAAVTICDINADMLMAGRTRPEAARHEAGVTWVCGDAERLPVPAARYDAYTIAFGIRNVTHIDIALAEARRVLKTGGRFLCLEFARVDVPFLDALYDQWSFKAIPAIGAAVAGDRESYQYLVESIRRFPAQDAFARMIERAGFERVSYTNLSGGIAAIHSGWVL